MSSVTKLHLGARNAGGDDVQLQALALQGEGAEHTQAGAPHAPFPHHLATHRFVGVGDAQGFLQRRAVLLHAQREVAVALVHGRHAFLDLSGVGMAFFAEAIRQLDQQLHSLFGLLWKTNTNTVSSGQQARCPGQSWSAERKMGSRM